MKFLFVPAFLILAHVLHAQISDFDSISFSKADSIAISFSGHDLKDPEGFAKELTKDLDTDVEKFRAIFRWVCQDISFDVEMYRKHVKKRNQFRYKKQKLTKWQQKVNRKAYQRVVDKKLALFPGYCILIETMSRAIGLSCITVDGFSKEEDGSKTDLSWTAVQLNNKWYVADAGQSSGYVDSTVTVFTKNFSETYFLTDPNYFIANHFPENGAWAFVYQRPTLKEFMAAPVREDGFIENQINQYHPRKAILKTKLDSAIVFRFTSNSFDPPKGVVVEMNNKKLFLTSRHKLEKNEVGEFYFSQKFTRKGKFQVYIYIKGLLAFIYEVYVS